MNGSMQSLFPVYLPRRNNEADTEAEEVIISQNENNLNQNFSILFDKILELEAQLAST